MSDRGDFSNDQSVCGTLIRFAPGFMAALAAFGLLSAAALLSPPVVGVATGAAEVYWRIPPGGLVLAPSVGEVPADLRRAPFGDNGPLHFFYRFQLTPADRPVTAVMAPILDGDPALTMNNTPAPTSSTWVGAGSHLARPGARTRCWDIDPTYLHPGENRIDLLVEAPTLRGLGASLYLSSGEDCSTLIKAADAILPTIRSLVPLLAVLAVVFALVAAATGGVLQANLGVAAISSSLGIRAWLAMLAPGVSLGPVWPIVDLLLLAAAAISAGLMLWPLLERGVWRRMLAACGLSAAGGASLAVVLDRADSTASSVVAAGAVTVSALFAIGVWARTARKLTGLGLSLGAAAGGVCGLGLVTLVAAIWAILAGPGMVGGLFAETTYSLGLCALLTAAAAGSAYVASRATWRLASIWLDQSRLVRSQREALDQQTRKSAVLEERQRLARDMHDGIGSRLASMIAQVRSRGIGIEQLEGELVGGLVELRLLVDSLDAVGESLAAALISFRGRVQPQAEAAGMTLEWQQSEPLEIETRDPRWLLNLYRLLQEAVANAVQHSGGDRLMVSIEHPGGQTLHICVEDNGAFRSMEFAGAGRGLSNMSHRARAMGATFEFGPRPDGPGARVRLTLDVPDHPGETG